MADLSYAAYKKWSDLQPGQTLLSFEDWQKQNGGGTVQVNGGPPDPSKPSNVDSRDSSSLGTRSDGSISPASFEQRLAAGEFAGNEGPATQLEVERRRRLIATNANGSGGATGGFDKLPPDIADIVLKDASGQAVRRARGGSARSSVLGGNQAFDVTAPIGRSSVLGDY